MSQKQMWFCVDHCGSVELFDSAEEAKSAAECYLEYERDNAPYDGWSEEVTQIMWGKIYGAVVQKYSRPRTEEDSGIDPMFETVVDYELIEFKKARDE